MTQFFTPAILYVDDEPSNLTLFRRAFGEEYLVKTVLSGEEALTLLKKETFPIVVSDQKMPEMSGIELCEKLVKIQPDCIRIILTAYTETSLLLQAIRRGQVHDYIVKPWKKSELKLVFEKAFKEYREKKEKLEILESKEAKSDYLQQEISKIYDFKSMIGISSGLQKVIDKIQLAAPTDSTLLIQGETGTGKELIARAIHESSPRKKEPFVAVHCAALSKSLLESELFGHAKGAFTGAETARIGRFELAHNGTLFLDEVGEIPEEIQVKLLRVIQEKEIQKVGSNKTFPINVRIISATHRHLEKEIDAGNFRRDLFYRLNVIPIFIPPLRERAEDIPLLANYFLSKFNHQLGKNLQLTKKAIDLLSQYDWPGNIRELQNIIERSAILSTDEQIEEEDLHLHFSREENIQINSPPLSLESIRKENQKKEIEQISLVLTETGGNLSQAAKKMGIARTTLFDRLKKYRMI